MEDLRTPPEMAGLFGARLPSAGPDNSGFEVFMTPKPPIDAERGVSNLVAGNTNLGWRLRCMVWVFYLLCAVQRYLPIVPRLALAQRPLDPECTPKEDARKPQMVAVDE